MRPRCKRGNHGHSSSIGPDSRTYGCWRNMKQRCLNPNNKEFKNYGARGITICDRWVDSFSAFLEDMGECPDSLTIERLDNSKGYEPGNCIWAPRSVQSRNRRTNVEYIVNGRVFLQVELANALGVCTHSMRKWFNKGKNLDWVVRHYKERNGREISSGV